MAKDYRGTTAIITGASAGLGAEFATQLAARGADVVLVARREDRLRELAGRLSGAHGVTATPIELDLAEPGSAAALRAALDERGIRPQTLVNNAGFGMKGAFAEADASRVDEMVAVNVAALVSLTREFLPDLVRDGRGALVNIASTAAYQPCPNMAVYGATKAFVLSLTEALAYETRASGLGVLALSPGATATEFFEVVGSADAAVGRFQTPDAVVRLALRRLDRMRMPLSVVSGVGNAVNATLARFIPRRLAVSVSGRVLR
ncbi:SDR family NAD(P)-dependent oxidoreductase [Agromyces silvae]|uniref:SDR family NAD(P)-dependent oxidoreductase n=1 Tax=Agromyces silvae TaxID=3388266 RepID=UPI00280AF2CD|nr:SDR family oxidoreductase [Agromyces protaetiae]